MSFHLLPQKKVVRFKTITDIYQGDEFFRLMFKLVSKAQSFCKKDSESQEQIFFTYTLYALSYVYYQLALKNVIPVLESCCNIFIKQLPASLPAVCRVSPGKFRQVHLR